MPLNMRGNLPRAPRPGAANTIVHKTAPRVVTPAPSATDKADSAAVLGAYAMIDKAATSSTTVTPRTKVNVARQAGHRIVEIAREENADLIVMGISHQNRPNESPLGRVAEHVVRNAHCEVVIDRVPRQKMALIPTEMD